MTQDLFDYNNLHNAFSNAATSYDQAAVMQREVANRMLERLDIFSIKPSVVLDLGCGTGYCYRRLKKRYRKASVYGLDIASGMLQVAKQQRKPFSRDQFIQADVRRLPFADNSVDMIFSNLLIHWCHDLSQLFAELARVLKPQGLLFFSTMGPDTLCELRSSWAQVDDYQHVNQFIDMHDIGDQLGHAKLADPVVEMEMLTIRYGQVRQLLTDIKAIGASNSSQQRRKTLTGKKAWQTMLDYYQQHYGDNGSYPASYEVVYGHAWMPALTMQHGAASNGEVRIPINHISKVQ